MARSLRRLGARLWAAPCSLVGLLLAVAVRLAGGRWQRRDGALEAALHAREAACGAIARRLPFRAVTLGHVIVAVTADDLERSRAHEQVHVRQYERWGPLFFVAYPACSAWLWLKGRRPYWDNPFEVQARRRAGGRP